MDRLFVYKRTMEQVDYPNGVKSVYAVVCTKKQAADSIGKLYKDNPAWRIVSMEIVRPFHIPSTVGQ